MSSDLVPRTDVPAVFADQMRMAEVLSQSTLLPGHLRGKPANVLVIMQGARALGIPAFWAFQALFVVDGKLSQSADLMKALVIGAGHAFRVVERTAQRAVVEIKRRDREHPYRAEFTWDDAITAELTKKDNWRKYPKAMMVARATAIAVRDECPEVLFGVSHTPDELGAVTNDEGMPEVDDAGRIVQMPTPDGVLERAAAIAMALEPETFDQAWAEVAALGWALERVPDSDSSLFDVAVCAVYAACKDADTVDEVKAWWPVAKRYGMLEHSCTVESREPIKLGDYMIARGRFIADFKQATAARNDPPDIIDVELPADDVKDEPGAVIDTDNARMLREQAADSWGDEMEGGRAP